MSTILLLGGRAPATLELARALNAAGYRVVGAESAPVSIAGASRAVARNYRLPPPAQVFAAFADALAHTINVEGATFVLPTCEEIFHAARARDLLPNGVTLFAPPLSDLRTAHHKAEFIAQARGFGLPVPETHLLETEGDLAPFLKESVAWVWKPAYSRFAARTLIRPTRAQAAKEVRPTRAQPWVAQRFLEGKQICTYSVAHKGRLTAHCAYPTEWTAGQGATIAFRAIEHPACRAWVEQYVAATGWTGQIAFDFIEQADGIVCAIECNPRATSGVHLLAGVPGFANAFLDGAQPCVTPAPGTSVMIGAAMAAYGLPAARGRVGAWWQTIRHSRDALWRRDDPAPWFAQWLALGAFVACGLRRGISPLEASTWDIEWNGE